MPDTSKTVRPEWVDAEYTAERERQGPAKNIFLAIVYVGDQLTRIVTRLDRLHDHFVPPSKRRHGED